jgi:hypothetical protein
MAESPKDIAKKLTANQWDVLRHLSKTFSLAPYCGCHRRQGGVASHLVKLGLAEVEYGRATNGVPMYRTSPLGEIVLQICHSGAVYS